jgi:hypothetical protein
MPTTFRFQNFTAPVCLCCTVMNKDKNDTSSIHFINIIPLHSAATDSPFTSCVNFTNSWILLTQRHAVCFDGTIQRWTVMTVHPQEALQVWNNFGALQIVWHINASCKYNYPLHYEQWNYTSNHGRIHTDQKILKNWNWTWRGGA